MRELSMNEINIVNGGLGPLVIPAIPAIKLGISFVGGAIGAYSLGHVAGSAMAS